MEPQLKNVDPNHVDNSSAQRSITGTIVPNEGMDRIGLRVQAFARSMPTVDLRTGSAPPVLGEAIADPDGEFQIRYTVEHLNTGEMGAPNRRIGSTNTNVSFRVFDRAGQELNIKRLQVLDQELRGDQIIFHAPHSCEYALRFRRHRKLKTLLNMSTSSQFFRQ